MSFFDNKGEVNASSLRDALTQIAKYASILESNQPSNAGLAGQVMSDSSRDELVAKAIQTQDGKIALAQAMVQDQNLVYSVNA